jgi:uncharacterized membrane protein YoaK (UPF0700 family)
LVAGCVDLIAYFVLYHVFTAHMSGNTVNAAAYAERHDWVNAAIHALPIPLFLIGVMLGVLIGTVTARLGWRNEYAPTLWLEAAALVGFIVLSPHVKEGHARVDAIFVATLAMSTLAMGLQNATLRRVSGKSVRTTFVTGMLTDFAEHAMKALLREGPVEPAMVAGSIWVAYLIGAGAGGVLFLNVGTIAMLLPVALLAVLAMIERSVATKGAARGAAESSRPARS